MSFWKDRPALLDKREAARDAKKADDVQRQICKVRSGGQCEVRERGSVRCTRRAAHNHHRLSGSGRRNVGDSLLAQYRIDVCVKCHEEIHGHVLVQTELARIKPNEFRYERVR